MNCHDVPDDSSFETIDCNTIVCGVTVSTINGTKLKRSPSTFSISLLTPSRYRLCLQGHSEVGGAQQSVPAVAGDDGVRRRVAARDVAEETAEAGAGEPRGPAGGGEGGQPGHPRVPAPVPEPQVELFDEELRQGQEPVRENRRER